MFSFFTSSMALGKNFLLFVEPLPITFWLLSHFSDIFLLLIKLFSKLFINGLYECKSKKEPDLKKIFLPSVVVVNFTRTN